ncbi:hypothetical protein ACFSHT_36245 [Paraburkholderia silviterrae]|uniref:hypothetical protein n=1 Tax=Paraburkholderia silviterrae TaxID=2528715 RepID=UPI001404D579|nr:hypothetical protein [Paraburkholderia silviterrae]
MGTFTEEALAVSITFTIITMVMIMIMTMTSIFIAAMTMTLIMALPWQVASTVQRVVKATAAGTTQAVSAVTFRRRERADRTGVAGTNKRNHTADSTFTIDHPHARPFWAIRSIVGGL